MSNWTEELLDLMVDKLVERKKREVATIKGHSDYQESASEDHVISDQAFFNQAGIKVIKG